MKEIAKEWIQKAEEDYRVAVRELKAKPPALNSVCSHTQQCIEKYLKAVLQENNISFQKIHDLDILVELLKGILPELERFRENLVKLNVYAVEVRYPGFNPLEKDAREAVSIMKKVRSFIRKFLQEDTKECYL